MKTPDNKNTWWTCAASFARLIALALGLAATGSTWASGEPAILDDAYLWLDASTLTGSAGDEVASWASRNAGGKTASTTGTKPTIATINGRNVVDFGAAGSGKDLTFDRTTSIRTVFMVADIVNNSGVFFLGDSSNFHFHRGSQGQYLYEYYGFTDALVSGVYRNGIKVDAPRSTTVPTGFGLITLAANANVAASRICQDRSESGRNGGKKIAELIIFNKTLTDAERGQVEEYLMDKWLKSRATISADTNWSDIVWEEAALSESSISYEVNVPSSAANTVNLTLNAALTSAKEIIFNVASGKTLYIAGSNEPACQVYINGEGTVSTTKTQILGTTPKVKVSYPAVWELTNNSDDTNDRGVNCSNITGDGTIRLKSTANKWRTLPWTSGQMWANTLGLDTMEQNGVILSEGNRCWEIGPLSGSYGIRSDYGNSYASSQRQIRFTQSRNTTWSGTFHSDRVDNVYVAGAAGAAEKTLTIDSGTVGEDNPLTVESSGSVKLTGKWKGNLTVQGEFGGSGSVQDATAISVASGATLRADWGATTFNVKPTFSEGIVNVIVSSLPEKDTATKIFSGTSFAVGTYENSYAIVKTADGTSKTCAAISAQADGVYVTATDDAIHAVLSSRPKYAYEFNGSYTSSGETEMTMSDGSIAAGDYAAGAVLKLGSNAGSHYSSGGFSYANNNYSYAAADWTIVTYVMAPGANQTIFAMAGNSGAAGMIGLRYAGSNQVKAFTASSTDLTGVTLSSDPTAGFHLYAIVYTASDGKVKMSVDGGEFTEGVSFTPGSANSWQFGGIYEGEVAAFAANATSGQMDSFRFYSVALTQADLSALLTSDYATVAKIGDNNFPTLGVAVADRASAETVVEVVADCTETAAVALTQNLVLTVASSASYTVSPVISGAFSVTKQGEGELTFAGANTYSGGTTVSAGILKRGSATAFGATGSEVTVSDTGTVNMNGTFSSSATYPFTIEGDGAAGHAYALTGATGHVQSATGIASIALSGNATIGSLNFGDNDNGACNCTLNGYTLKTTGAVNGYNVKFYYTGTSGDNETVPETDGGTLEIASGTYTANTWNNSGENITLKIDAGATYSANVNSNDRCIFKNVVNNGTVSMNSTHTLTINENGTYSGSGMINNLRLKPGVTVIAGDEDAPVDVTNSLVIDGVYGVDISALDLSSKEAGDKVPLMKAISAFDLMKLTSVVRGSNSVKWLPYTEAGTGDDEGKYILGVELGSYDAELSWNGDSATWSGSSFNGGDNNYSDSALQFVTFADKGESTDPVTVTVSGAKTVNQLAFTADNRNVTLSGDAITAGTVLKGGDGVVTINSALSVLTALTVNDGVLVLNPTDEVVSDVWTASDDGTLVVYVGSGNTTTISIPITATKLIKRGAGTLVLENAGNAISQGTVIEAGTIKVNQKNASNITQVFGSGSVTIAADANGVGGALDVNNCYVENQIYICGNGPSGNGALVNNTTNMGSDKAWKVSLTGNASWGGNNFIHFGASSSIVLNGYTFTKKGSNNFPLNNTTMSGSGTIVVEAGEFQNNSNVNDLSGIDIVIKSGATLNMAGGISLSVKNCTFEAATATVTANSTIGNSAKLIVNGTLAVNGTLSLPKLEMASAAGISFAGASAAITVGNAFTLPATGTVNIDASAMTSLTSSGATIITSADAFAEADVAKLKSVGRHVFELDGTDSKKINVYPAVAKVDETYYADLAVAETDFAANSQIQHFEVYSGEVSGTYHTLSTEGGVTTYRKQNQNIYYQTGKYWSTATQDLFKLADGTVTPAYAGDTIVIDSSSSGEFWADPANSVAATAISVSRNVTIKQGEGTGNLFDGKTITVADGSDLTISGASRTVTLGAVTFNKVGESGTGTVTLAGDANGVTLNGNLSGTAPITVSGTVTASGKTIGNTLVGSGTIVYDGTLPDTAPTFDSSWTGTVWLKNYTNLTGTSKQGSSTFGTTNFEPNNYGNSSSTVKFTGVKGYLTAPDDGSYTILPALELEDSGDTPGLLLYNGWGYNANAQCYTIIRELKGSGTLKADPTADGANGTIKGLNVLLQVLNWGNFSGTLNMMNKNVVFGSTLPEQSLVEGSGKIFVRSGASVTIPSTKTWTCVTNFVNGTLTVNGTNTLSSAMVISDTGLVTLANSGSYITAPTISVAGELRANKYDISGTGNFGSTTAIEIGDTGTFNITGAGESQTYLSVNYSKITGTGTIKFSGTGWYPLPSNGTLDDDLGVEVEKGNGLILPPGGITIGSLSGTKNLRSDLEASQGGAATEHALTIKQSKDTTWSGHFVEGDRVPSVTVSPGDSTSGVLTLAGDQFAYNDSNPTKVNTHPLTINSGAAVNLSGTWSGDVSVLGTFGGVGTASRATFTSGSTFKVYDAENCLTVTGGVTVAAGHIVWVEFANGVTPVADMVLMDWTAPDGAAANAAPAGAFRFANETYRASWTPKVVGSQLVVKARTSETIDVDDDDVTEYSGTYLDVTLTKTGTGTAQFTGSLDGVILTISEGTVELAGATVSSTTISGSGTLAISANTDLSGLTLGEFSGDFDIAYGVKVTVTADLKTAILEAAGEGVEYDVVENKDGTFTISVKARATVIDFATNDTGVSLAVPETGRISSYGKITGVEIGSTPIVATGMTSMSRIVPYTISVNVTIPEEIPENAPAILSWDIASSRIGLALDADGHLQGTWNDALWSNTDDRNKVENNLVFEAGKTYHINLRYWCLVIEPTDHNTPYQSCGYAAADDVGVSVWVDGTQILKCPGLKTGTYHNNATSEDQYSNYHPTKIVFGGTAKETPDHIFAGLIVNAAGFINGNGIVGNVISDADHWTLTYENPCYAATPSLLSSDSMATYMYDFGVCANGVSGGYELTKQTALTRSSKNSGGWSNTPSYTRGVIMSHSNNGEDEFTLTMGVYIPEGSAGGTICNIPMSEGTLSVTYDGETDKFSLNGTAQAQTNAAGDGAHVLVLTYDATYGAYLWVDTYDENRDPSHPANYTIAKADLAGKVLSAGKIYFGSGSATTSDNGFFAGLGVVYQNLQFDSSVCDEKDVEAALDAFEFDVELASMPLLEKLKYLANIAHDGGTVPVPAVTVSGKTLTGYAALNASRILGAYTNITTTLQMSGFDPATTNLICAVDPSYAGKTSVSLAGTTNGLVWTRLEVGTISAESNTVSLNLGGHAFGNSDYTRFKIIEEAYTNGATVAKGRIHEMLANRPTVDKIFKYGETGWNQDVYRIPAMAATPDGQTVMGIFDARYCYQDLGVPLDANGNNGGESKYSNPDHYTGIDIGGVFSLDGGESWSYPQVMIDVPNASDPQTGDKTIALTAEMELGDPSIVYDPTSQKFYMMGITGGGLTTVDDGTNDVDVVTYECSLASVTNGAPEWTNRTSVKSAIEAALKTDGGVTIPAYKQGYLGSTHPCYQGILEGPGHAFVTRAACGSIPAGTVVWPMQYVLRTGNWAFSGGNFAAWYSGGAWHATKLVPNSDAKGYVTQEGCITQLDDGSLLYMCKKIGGGTRPFYKSTDGVNWTFLNEIAIAGSEAHQGSILRIGEDSNHYSRYAAVFATGALRSDIKVYIGTDTGSGSVSWGAEPYETVWAGATGTDKSQGSGANGNLVYGYNSLVMLNPTTLGVLFEAHGHIYFTKVDVTSALQ